MYCTIDHMELMSIPHETESEMDCGQKGGYYAAILSGKIKRLQSIEHKRGHFASSFLTSAGSYFTFPTFHPERTRPQQYLTITEANKLTCSLIDAVSSQSTSLYLSSLDLVLPCHSKWQRSIRISVHCPFYMWLCE